jgi:hypothetical protein
VLVEVGVNPAAPSGSILFDRPSDRGERDAALRDVPAVDYRCEPLPASYGQDPYQSVFATADQTARA